MPTNGNGAGAAGDGGVSVGSTDELRRIVEFDMWSEVAGVFAGFLAPELFRRAFDHRIGAPDEAYGVLTMAVSLYFFDGSWARSGAVGGGLHTVDRFVNGRLGAADRVADQV